MINVTCPNCGEEATIDPAVLAGISIIGCQSCDSQFAFTLVGDVLTFGEEVSDDDDIDDVCGICGVEIDEDGNCECADDGEDDEDEDDDTEIDVEDEDGDA